MVSGSLAEQHRSTTQDVWSASTVERPWKHLLDISTLEEFAEFFAKLST